MRNLIPKSLRKGDTIGLVSLSSPLTPGARNKGVHYLKDMGFNWNLINILMIVIDF